MAEEKIVIGLDVTDVEKGSEKIVKDFDKVGEAAERNSKKIDRNSFGKDILASLDGITKTLVNSFGELIDAQKDTNKALTELKGNVKSVSKEETVHAKALGGVKQELRETTNELTNLTVKYRQLTDEEKRSKGGREMLATIEKLTAKAGNLRDVTDDTTRSIRGMASDTAKLDAVTQGMNLASSAAGALVGTLGMVGVSEERQAEIQTKLQASLAISNALTVAQNTLQKESALMLGISAIKANALAKAELYERAIKISGTKATIAATAAQKAFNIVANANPYVLLAGAILSVVGVLVAFSKGVNKQKKGIEETTEAQKKAIEAQKEYYKVMSQGAGDTIAKYNALVLTYKNLKTTAEKTQWIKDNKSAFDSLGISINNLNDAEKVFLNNTEQMMQTFRLRTKLAALQKLAAEEIENAEAQRKADANFGGLSNGKYNLYDISAEGYTKEYVKVQEEVEKLQKQLGVFKKDTIVKKEKSNLEDLKVELSEAYRNMVAKVKQSENTAMQEGTAKTLEQLQFDKEQQLAEVKKLEKEYLKKKQEVEKQKYIESGGKAENFNADNVKLNEDEIAQLQALRNGVLVEYSNAMDEVLEKERQNVAERERIQREAMNVYLEQYGTYAQQIHAIIAIYNEEIKNAETTGEKLRLAAERDAKIKDKQNEQNQKTVEHNRKVIDSTKDLISAIGSLGDAIGGTSGELVDLAVNAGMTITNTIEGLQAASEASSAAIQTVEKASVILMAISAAVQIATKVAQLFNNDDDREASIERLQQKVKGLQREYNHLQQAVENTYSTEKQLNIEKQVENKKKQILAIQQQINEESQKKKSDDGKIADWRENIKDLEDDINNLKRTTQDALFGQDIKTAIEDFADAYISAWSAGESKAKSAKEQARNMMRSFVTESIKMMVQNEGSLQRIRDMIQDFMSDGIISAWEQDTIENAAENLQRAIDAKYGWADKLFKEDNTQSKTGGGFATASQDSIDELNGRFTAVQMNTNRLAESVTEINQLASAQAEHLAHIRLQTEQSVNLGMEAVTSLAAIEKNTRELYSMNERLANIERNTSNI